MRVISGVAKGRRLKCPKGRSVRPTADRVREAIFSSLGRRAEGARVLDLFAGAGTLGIEALSRGAEHATFIERSARIARNITENLERCGLGERALVVVAKATVYLSQGPADGMPFDLIFLDPPYRIADTDVEEALKGLVDSGFLAAGGLIVLERSSSARTVGVDPLVVRNAKVYGDSAVTILEKRAVGEG